jgi:hypothetical protein
MHPYQIGHGDARVSDRRACAARAVGRRTRINLEPPVAVFRPMHNKHDITNCKRIVSFARKCQRRARASEPPDAGAGLCLRTGLPAPQPHSSHLLVIREITN